MTTTLLIENFWRVGRRAGPLDVLPEYQGKGRFDDPEHLIAALYGAPVLRTCLYELLRPWPEALGAAAVLNAIPAPGEDEEEAEDAKKDREIAKASVTRPVPPYIYDRDAVLVGMPKEPIVLLDLRNVAVQEQLATQPDIAREMRCFGYLQLDRGTLLAPIQHRTLTQAVASAAMLLAPG